MKSPSCLLVCIALYTITTRSTTVAEPIVVQTGLGRVIGKLETLNINGQDVNVKRFLGIPYAKPPTGDRRFRKPELAGEFDGTFEATEFGAVCFQPPSDAYITFPKMSEDCLFLNIYVPDQEADRETGHAVMVFIHGGGFQYGAGQIYPGESLASTGNVIVITLNYRLGIFGFLSSGDAMIPGNFGLWDQHIALQWINKYIGSFGGDPARVTLFGESAGASCVIYQGLLPNNKDLINRVISQSGAPSLKVTLNAMPKEQLHFIAHITGCLRGVPLEMINCIRNVDAHAIMLAMRQVAINNPDMKAMVAMVFLPTVDGDFFETSPNDLYTESRIGTLKSVDYFRSLDVLIGHNSHDGALMLYDSIFYPIPDMDTFLPSREDLSSGMIDAVMAHVFGVEPFPKVIQSMYISEFTDWSDPFSPESIREQYVDMMGNVAFDKSTIEFIRIHANCTSSATRYAYVFDAAPSVRLLKTPSWLSGANHADELGFVFGFMDGLVEGFNNKPSPPMEWEWELSKLVQIQWSNFAKTGNPNEPVQGTPVWPQYDMTQQQCLKIQRGMTDKDFDTIPYCNARRANFLLDIVPEVMSAINSRHDESSPFIHLRKKAAETCDTEGACIMNSVPNHK